jgi:integrase
MNQAVYDVLFDRIKESPDKHVFDRPLMINALRKLQTICKMTDQRVIRFHDLRHTFASCLAMAGVDLMVIQKLMRHKSYQMTLRYAHLHPEHLKGSTEVLAGTQTARRFEAVN